MNIHAFIFAWSLVRILVAEGHHSEVTHIWVTQSHPYVGDFVPTALAAFLHAYLPVYISNFDIIIHDESDPNLS